MGKTKIKRTSVSALKFLLKAQIKKADHLHGPPTLKRDNQSLKKSIFSKAAADCLLVDLCTYPEALRRCHL